MSVQVILEQLGLAQPYAITRIRGGWDTAIWRVEHSRGTFALRVFRAEQLAQSKREVAVMQLAADAGLPVPRIYGQTVWQDQPAIVMEWCPGQPLLQEVQSRPWRTWRDGVAMGRMQARIHAVKVPQTVAEGLRPWIPRAGEAETQVQEGVQQMASTKPALLHLDYHPLNVMVAGPSISGVLDWANVAAGDPRADFARTVTLLQLAPTPPDAAQLLVAVARRVLEAAWRVGYQRLAGPLSDMAPFYAWAGAMMEADMAPKLGKEGVWLQASDLHRIHRWTLDWKRKAGRGSSHIR